MPVADIEYWQLCGINNDDVVLVADGHHFFNSIACVGSDKGVSNCYHLGFNYGRESRNKELF